MSPIELIRHNWLGSTLSETLCYDPKCHSPAGPKVLKQIFHGYGEEAYNLCSREQNDLRKSAAEHLKLFPKHNISIFIGHKEHEIDEETGYSKVVYEYHAPWSEKD